MPGLAQASLSHTQISCGIGATCDEAPSLGGGDFFFVIKVLFMMNEHQMWHKGQPSMRHPASEARLCLWFLSFQVWLCDACASAGIRLSHTNLMWHWDSL